MGDIQAPNLQAPTFQALGPKGKYFWGPEPEKKKLLRPKAKKGKTFEAQLKKK